MTHPTPADPFPVPDPIRPRELDLCPFCADGEPLTPEHERTCLPLLAALASVWWPVMPAPATGCVPHGTAERVGRRVHCTGGAQ